MLSSHTRSTTWACLLKNKNYIKTRRRVVKLVTFQAATLRYTATCVRAKSVSQKNDHHTPVPKKSSTLIIFILWSGQESKIKKATFPCMNNRHIRNILDINKLIFSTSDKKLKNVTEGYKVHVKENKKIIKTYSW